MPPRPFRPFRLRARAQLAGAGFPADRAAGPAATAAREPRPKRAGHPLRAAAIATVTTAAVFGASDATTGTSRGMLSVGATVPLVAVMQIEHQAAQLSITQADIDKGYIDAPSASQFKVKTTSRAGYRIDVNPRLQIFRSVEVTLPSGTVSLGPEGGAIVARGSPTRETPTSMSYRFYLGRDVAPGVYPWPLALSAHPL